MPIEKRKKLRSRILALVLVVLGVMFALRETLTLVPHEPRFFLVNDSLVDLEAGNSRTDRGDLLSQSLRYGESVRLDLLPRADRGYWVDHHEIEGSRLLELMELARSTKGDVEITVGFDYLDLDVTTRHRFLWW